jgi:glutamyl-tRNA synthetase
VTEVVRGGDLVMSTARQLLLYRALKLPEPSFFHCPLVCDESGKRLAKRVNSEAISRLREANYTADQVRSGFFQVTKEQLQHMID